LKQNNSKVLSGLMGVCVGDALGVPVEFYSRDRLSLSRVTGIQGYGTYNQPPGTWSDDSSLTFCLAEALAQEKLTTKLIEAIANNFCRWYEEGYWTPYGTVFDIGGTTIDAIERLQEGISPVKAGGSDEFSNGNGSLMRILPLAFCHSQLEFSELIELVHQVSCITHAHPRSQISCGIYISIAVSLLEGKEPSQAYLDGIQRVQEIYQQLPYAKEIFYFYRVSDGKIGTFPIDAINSGGYVIDTLEASLWCFLNSSSYSEAVLKAVNMGGDTDTTAAVTGGLAGIYYGIENIPANWIEQIAKKDDIIDLAARLETAIAFI
jgi:ADP-ribosyl-[dinitrogen reductase] hydrolase